MTRTSSNERTIRRQAGAPDGAEIDPRLAISCCASGSAGYPTSALIPADSIQRLARRGRESRSVSRRSAIGLRQMLPVQTIRTRLNTGGRSLRAGAKQALFLSNEQTAVEPQRVAGRRSPAAISSIAGASVAPSTGATPAGQRARVLAESPRWPGLVRPRAAGGRLPRSARRRPPAVFPLPARSGPRRTVGRTPTGGCSNETVRCGPGRRLQRLPERTGG